MTQTIEAIFTVGVLKPLEVLPLHEQQRVRVTVETIESEPTDRRKAALHRLIDRLERSTLSLGGALPSREELHERDRHF